MFIGAQSSDKVLSKVGKASSTGPLKCALYDIFSMSGCGAYSYTGKRKLPSKDNSSSSLAALNSSTTTTTTTGTSMLRTAFLQVEKEFYRLLSTSTDDTSNSTNSSSSSSQWYLKNRDDTAAATTTSTKTISSRMYTAFNSLMEFLPRYQYDKYTQKTPLRIQKVRPIYCYRCLGRSTTSSGSSCW